MNQFEKTSQNIIALLICVEGSFLTACMDGRLVGDPPEIREKTMSLKIVDYCPTEGFNFGEIFSFNSSTMSLGDRHTPDYDRDGLSDNFESHIQTKTTYNISAEKSDTNGDGYSDLLVHLIGYNAANQSRLRVCSNPNDDTDFDYLADCAEATLRTSPLDPDTDHDGIPDGLEVRFGLNPTDALDSRGDFDQDGSINLEELKMNTPITSTNTARIWHKAYNYSVSTKIGGGGTNCYDIVIGNIPLLPLENGNLVQVLAVENKPIIGQGDVLRVRTLKVLVPEERIVDKSRLVVTDIVNQLVDGISIPWIIESGRAD